MRFYLHSYATEAKEIEFQEAYHDLIPLIHSCNDRCKDLPGL